VRLVTFRHRLRDPAKAGDKVELEVDRLGTLTASSSHRHSEISVSCLRHLASSSNHIYDIDIRFAVSGSYGHKFTRLGT
jgi:hypothetical protein